MGAVGRYVCARVCAFAFVSVCACGSVVCVSVCAWVCACGCLCEYRVRAGGFGIGLFLGRCCLGLRACAECGAGFGS